MNLATQSPHIVVLLATRLGSPGGTALLRKAILHHPTDFWLHLTLGNMTEDAAEKIGFYRAALALRPPVKT